jgi:RNA polymerase sigma-70 factor (ECF subfamily)
MATKEKTDKQLIAEFKRGNQQSFEELIGRYSTRAFSMAQRLTRSKQDAEEVLQDVFVTVYRKIKGFEGKSSFSSWLYRVTVNASLMKLRKKRQDQSVPLEDLVPQMKETAVVRVPEGQEVDAITLRNQLKDALDSAIRKLPDDYRPVFVLRDVDGLTNREVGKILNLTVPAVKSRLHRSRIMLRRKLLKVYRDFAVRDVSLNALSEIMDG